MEKPPCPYHTPFKWDFCVKFTHFSHLKGVRGMRKTLMMNRTAGIDNNPAPTSLTRVISDTPQRTAKDIPNNV